MGHPVVEGETGPLPTFGVKVNQVFWGVRVVFDTVLDNLPVPLYYHVVQAGCPMDEDEEHNYQLHDPDLGNLLETKAHELDYLFETE